MASMALTASAAFSAPNFAEPLVTMPAPVEKALFGMHAIADPPTGIPGMNAVRLWDTDTTWRVLNPERGIYRWDTLDARVQAAVDSGTTVLLVLGATPEWAATALSHKDAEWLGRGSASAPTSIPDWADFVAEVVKRYGGRIEAYQIWNEPSDPIFWRGSWDYLARMTKVAADVIYRYDSNAKVIAAPLTIRGPQWRADARAYIDALAHHALPVDAMAFHGYFNGPPGADSYQPIRRLQHLLATSPAAGLPLWETEVNFRRELNRQRPDDATERWWLARAYLDAIRLGLERVYWYAYAELPDFLAVDVRRNSVTRAFSSVSAWLGGARFRGCTQGWQHDEGVTACSFVDDSDRTAVALWSTHPHTVIVGRGSARDLQGHTWSVMGDELTVDDSPQWFQPSQTPG